MNIEQLVVLGGWVGNVSQSNTVFMESCPLMDSEIADLPLNISHGVGTIIDSGNGSGASIIICGGIEAEVGPIIDCFEFDLSGSAFDLREAAFTEAGQWTKIPSLGTKRGNAAINFLPSSEAVWITGGRKAKRLVLDSTEIITKQADGKWQFKEGPTLSQPVAGHCTVTVTEERIFGFEDTIIIIGGAYFDSKKRKFVRTDIVEGYTFGPKLDLGEKRVYSSLRTARSGHACTLITEKDGSAKLLVAGGKGATNDVLDSVEFILLDQLFSQQPYEWNEHSSLPRPLSGATFITKMGLPFLVGGAGYKTDKADKSGSRKSRDLVFSKDVFTYSGHNNRWEKTGDVIETVAYHITLALENDICLEIKNELTRDLQDSEKETELWNEEDFFDVRNIFIN